MPEQNDNDKSCDQLNKMYHGIEGIILQLVLCNKGLSNKAPFIQFPKHVVLVLDLSGFAGTLLVFLKTMPNFLERILYGET